MLKRWILPLMALLIVACGRAPSTEGHAALQDSTAPGAKYTLLHAWAPW